MSLSLDSSLRFPAQHSLPDDKHQLVADELAQRIEAFVEQNREALQGAECIEIPCLPGDDSGQLSDHQHRAAVIRRTLIERGFRAGPLIVSRYVRNERFFVQLALDGDEAIEARARRVEAELLKVLSHGLKGGAVRHSVELADLSLELTESPTLAAIYATDEAGYVSESERTRVTANFKRLNLRISEVVEDAVKRLCSTKKTTYKISFEAQRIRIVVGEHQGVYSPSERKQLVREGWQGTEALSSRFCCC